MSKITITTFLGYKSVVTKEHATKWANLIVDNAGNRKNAIEFLRRAVKGISLEELGIKE